MFNTTTGHMQINMLWRLGLVLFFAFGGFVYSLGFLSFEITSPRIGSPTILSASDSKGFVIDLKTNWPWRLSKAEVRLKHRLSGHEYPVVVENIESTAIRDNRLNALLPKDLSPGSYDLQVSYGQDLRVRKKALHVWDSYPQDLKVIQIADLPIFRTSDDSVQRMEQLVQEINFVAPDVVFASGDVAKGGRKYQYQTLLQALEKIEAPVIVAPGNHAYDGWAYYLQYIGKPNHITELGPYRIYTINSQHGRNQFTHSQFNWLQSQFDKNNDRWPLVQMHHPVFPIVQNNGELKKRNVRVKVPEFINLLKQHNVQIVVNGHMHSDSLFNEAGERMREQWDFPGIKFVTTTAAGDRLYTQYSDAPLFWGYRLIRLKSGKVVNYTYDYDGDGARDAVSSIPSGHLDIDIIPNGWRVINNLNESFNNASLWARIDPTFKNPVVNHGHIINKINNNVQIQFNSPANSHIEITVSEAKP